MKYLPIALVLLTGCASPSLVVMTSPPGASVVMLPSLEEQGRGPATVEYSWQDLNANKTKDGCYLLHGFGATWISGAVAATPDTIEVCNMGEEPQHIVLVRPEGHENAKLDRLFGQRWMEYQQLLAQEEAAKAAYGAAIVGQSLQKIGNQPRQPVSCTSNTIGGTTFTDCQ